jgi:hypothetical protein
MNSSKIRFHERCSPDTCSRDSRSPATFALEAQTKSRSTPTLNLCFALTHAYIHILIYALTSLELAPTPSTIWGATLAGEQVSGEHHSCYPKIRFNPARFSLDGFFSQQEFQLVDYGTYSYFHFRKN